MLWRKHVCRKGPSRTGWRGQGMAERLRPSLTGNAYFMENKEFSKGISPDACLLSPSATIPLCVAANH